MGVRTRTRREDVLTLSLRERDRISVLRQVAEGVLGPKEGAERLGLSSRQFRRIRRRWEQEGDRAVVHRGRGRGSNRRLPDGLRCRALQMAADPLYQDFGPTLLSEHVAADPQGGPVHPSTLRLWMIEADLWKAKPRRRRHRRRRPRRPARGEMVLMDSSEHDWLEGRSEEEEMSLVAMIDDATSEVFAAFYPRDTGLANRQVIAAYLREHGRMGALYVDRASHFGNWRSPHGSRKAGEEADPVMVHSIIRRGLEALEVELILALSPQAKGRVERLFGTLQDRLIKEMRVAGIASREDANRFLQEVFLPFWKEHFTLSPQNPTDAHRPLPGDVDLNVLFAETDTRLLREDFTFRYRNEVWQIEAAEAQDLRPKQKVTIERRLDGSVHYRCAGRYLHPCRFVAPSPEPVAAAETAQGKTPVTRPRPAADHPWRRPVLPIPTNASPP
ncbi:MAG: ISNCY family transposase [Gemmatimonas sp.]|nr:ISNCY family transposase [Gemmatimonas sp.]